MGQDGVGVGAAETGCMPVILLQGRQEGQMGFLVSVLAPSGKKGLGDCESGDGQDPLTPGLPSHTQPTDLLLAEVWCTPPCPPPVSPSGAGTLASNVMQWTDHWALLSDRWGANHIFPLLAMGP